MRLSFFQPYGFFGGLPFALLMFQFKAAFTVVLFLLVICRESSPFIWPPGPLSSCQSCCSLEWQPDSPLALSFETLGLR